MKAEMKSSYMQGAFCKGRSVDGGNEAYESPHDPQRCFDLSVVFVQV